MCKQNVTRPDFSYNTDKPFRLYLPSGCLYWLVISSRRLSQWLKEAETGLPSATLVQIFFPVLEYAPYNVE